MAEATRERRYEKGKPYNYSKYSPSTEREQPPLPPLHQTSIIPSHNSFPQPLQCLLTLHVEGDAVSEAVQLVVDHTHELLPMGFAARHQAVPADHRDGAIAVPDLLKLCFPFQLGVPGDGAGGLPIGGDASGYQDLFCPA